MQQFLDRSSGRGRQWLSWFRLWSAQSIFLSQVGLMVMMEDADVTGGFICSNGQWALPSPLRHLYASPCMTLVTQVAWFCLPYRCQSISDRDLVHFDFQVPYALPLFTCRSELCNFREKASLLCRKE